MPECKKCKAFFWPTNQSHSIRGFCTQKCMKETEAKASKQQTYYIKEDKENEDGTSND